MKRNSENITVYESVKIRKDIVDMVRANKLITGVPVSVFFEKAAEEKLPNELKGVMVKTEYHAAMSDLLVKESNKKKK